MQGFFNYVNRQLCEYQSIFPNTVRLLDHILFTNGTGLHVDIKTGMIYDGFGKNKFIDKYPKMNDKDWQVLIEQCHAKERNFAEQFAHGKPIDEEYLAENCARYKQVFVDASMFSEEYLYNELCVMSRAKAQDDMLHDLTESFVRPYPLSVGYANIFDLKGYTPKWFLEIARNNCKAWTRFLTEEIEQNHVWIQPSLRPKSANHEQKVAAMQELFNLLKSDPSYDGWLDKKRDEPQSDYADLTWTTKHRDLLAGEVQRLNKLLNV